MTLRVGFSPRGWARPTNFTCPFGMVQRESFLLTHLGVFDTSLLVVLIIVGLDRRLNRRHTCILVRVLQVYRMFVDWRHWLVVVWVYILLILPVLALQRYVGWPSLGSTNRQTLEGNPSKHVEGASLLGNPPRCPVYGNPSPGREGAFLCLLRAESDGGARSCAGNA